MLFNVRFASTRHFHLDSSDISRSCLSDASFSRRSDSIGHPVAQGAPPALSLPGAGWRTKPGGLSDGALGVPIGPWTRGTARRERTEALNRIRHPFPCGCIGRCRQAGIARSTPYTRASYSWFERRTTRRMTCCHVDLSFESRSERSTNRNVDAFPFPGRSPSPRRTHAFFDTSKRRTKILDTIRDRCDRRATNRRSTLVAFTAHVARTRVPRRRSRFRSGRLASIPRGIR